MLSLSKEFVDKYFVLFKVLASSCVPFLIAILFMGIDGLTFLIPTLCIAIILCILFSMIAAFPLALILSGTLVNSFWPKIIIMALGLIAGATFFHYNNAFYGTPRSCFKLATGIRPLFEIQVIRFEESSWTDYSFELTYKAASDFNKQIIHDGNYERIENRNDSLCFRKSNAVYVNNICFDSTFQYGSIAYSVD